MKDGKNAKKDKRKIEINRNRKEERKRKSGALVSIRFNGLQPVFR
jgi:hypothetical protein